YEEESALQYHVHYDEEKRTHILGQTSILRQGTKDVSADTEISRRERVVDVLNVLRHYDPKAPTEFTLTIEPNVIRTASPQELVKDAIAGCNMLLHEVIIHPLVFYHSTAKRLEIFYHELISHIVTGLQDEAAAMKHTKDAFLSFANPWGEKEAPGEAVPMKITLIDAGSPRTEINEALGIEILAGALRAHFKGDPEVSVKMHDLQLEKNEDKIFAEIQESLPDVIGLALKIGTFPLGSRIIDFALSLPLDKRPIIFLGNTIATFAAKELIDRYPDALICQGEGEDAISGVARLVLQMKRLFGNRAGLEALKKIILARNIPNLFFNLWETIVITDRKSVDLSHYPLPERETLSEVIKLGGIVTLESSRGCPYGRCSFCVVKGRFPGWRPISIEKVFLDLERIIKDGANSVRFIEEDFLGTDLARAKAIAEGIIRRGWNSKIRFAFATRVKMVFDSRRSQVENAEAIWTLKLLKEAGLDTVFLGIESGSPEQLKRYKKDASVEENKVAIKVLKDLGIKIEPGFIMFDQLMNVNELRENIVFLETTGLIHTTSRIMGQLRPQEGSDYKRELSKIGLLKEDSRDINSLSYDALYRNRIIRRIVRIFQEWEKQEKGVTDFLQGRLRGNISKEEQEIVESHLKQLRFLDFMLVKELARAPENDRDLRVKFVGSRALLIQQVVGKLEQLHLYDVRSILGEKTLDKLGVVSFDSLSRQVSEGKILIGPSELDDGMAKPFVGEGDEEPRVVIIAGVTGAGKNTLFEPFLEQYAHHATYPPVYTTRSPREGEVDGQYRKFLTEKEFRNLHGKGGMVIWSPKHDVFYGLNRQDIVSAARDKKVILIESTGLNSLHKLRKAFPSARALLILPMSYERMDQIGWGEVEKALLQRIAGRGGVSVKEVTQRLSDASAALAQFRQEPWDGVIINDS
ncbi:MAG: radical SAM protein, partial [Deltaproteobacteria bacterium]